jgi:UPF0716 protein FxsA
MAGCLTLLLVLGVPAFDVWLLFRIGDRLGGWNTVALVVLAALAGLALARRQRDSALASIPAQLAAGRVPAASLADGPMLMLAALLFVLPGFVTDALGLLLLVPPVRRLLFALLVRRLALAAKQGRVRVGLFGSVGRPPGAGADTPGGPGAEAPPGLPPFRPSREVRDLPPGSYRVSGQDDAPE